MFFYFDFRAEGYDPSFIPLFYKTSKFIEDNCIVTVKEDYDKAFGSIFVDGVMRKEANIVTEDSGLVNLVLYSIGAGAVLNKPDQKPILLEESIKIKRLILTRSDDLVFKHKIKSEWEIVFKDTLLSSCVVETDKDLSPINYLKALESAVIEETDDCCIGSDNIIILDGPLQMSFKGKKVIGLIKTIKEIYIEEKDFLKLKNIKAGISRSGIFIIDEPEQKYSWYVRLNDNESWFYNIIRLECFRDLFSEEEVKVVADFTALFLPRLVNIFDIRTPQNLAPVSYLEKSLKTRLGNSDIIKYIIKNKGY